jgi:type IV pilus assembly protein PilA
VKAMGDKGFTLIELLIVVAIIGVLTAIAIPQFAAYRQKSFDAQAAFDLRNAATAEEAYYAIHFQYIVCASAGTCVATLPGLTVEPNTSMAVEVEDAGGFMGTATSSKGTGATCRWDSLGGGFLGCR